MSPYPTSFDRDALLACARGELFGPGNAQLPEPPMLMMDRITSISEDGGEHGKGHVVAEFDITPDLWFFDCHFPGNPIMPGCLGLDGLWQLTGFNLGWRDWPGRGYALGVGEAAREPRRVHEAREAARARHLVGERLQRSRVREVRSEARGGDAFADRRIQLESGKTARGA